MNSTLRRLTRSRRGTALIVALIFSLIIAISITSYMKLTLNAMKLADRSFYANGAENLLDTGFEQVLWSLNNSDWTTNGGFAARGVGFSNQYQATFPTSSTFYNFSQGVKGQLKIWVDASTANPHAVVKATVTLGDGTTMFKMAEAYMRRRSYFANGLVARDRLRFVGNVMIDSWNSDPDNNSATAAVAYSGSVDTDGGRIASLSVQVDSIAVGNADVYGYAAIGSSDLSGIDVGSTGRVGPYGTANGAIDATRVTFDFTTNFPDVSAPNSGSVSQSYTITAITGNTVLPVGGHSTASDGKYYYYVPSIDIAGSDTITISGSSKVVLVVTDTSGTTVKAAGTSSINIPSTSSLEMYAAGNVAITGNGVVNGGATTPNQPQRFQLFGTKSATEASASGMQTISIRGNGYLSGVVYAPNANVDIYGNGDTYGAIVANQVTMNGNGNFHYDESLANMASTNLWSLSKWRELTVASDRNVYTTQLAF